MNKELLKKIQNIITTSVRLETYYFVFIISMFGLVSNAQCIGPYQTFESFKTVPAGWNLTSGVTSFTSFSSTSSRSGSNLLAQSGTNAALNTTTLNYPAVITPAITNPKTVSFYVQKSAAAGVAISYDFQYSPDNGSNWYTIPNGTNTVNGESITATVPTLPTTLGLSGWNLVTATFNTNHLLDLPLPTSTTFKFRIRDTRSIGTFNTTTGLWSGTGGALWLDDFSVSTYNTSPDDNLIVVPELGTSTSCGPITIPPSVVYKFYDQGGLNDNYNKSQTQIMIFKPQSSTDKVRVTFVNNFGLDANSTITVYNGNGAVVGNELLSAYTSTATKPGATQSPVNSYTSTNPGDYLTVKFVSSTTAPSSGFDINVECPSTLSISSLGSTSGCQGSSLIINGSGFTGTTTVTVGGTAVSSIVSNTGTVLTVIPAPGSTGSVAVTNGATVSFGTYTVNPLPTVTAGASVCVGSSITLSPTTGGTWSSSDITKATVTNAGLVTGVAPGSATFTFTNTTTGCSATTSSVAVNALPVVSAGASVCVGSTITLSPTTGGTWASSDNTKATVTNAGVVTGVAAGSVTFTFTNTTTGCSATTSSVTVGAAPTNTLTTTTAQSYCLNAVATPLSVTATTSAGIITGYQWYSNTVASTSGSSLISGATSDSYTPLTTAVGTSYYYCVVTNTAGCTATSAISGAIVVSSSLVAPVATTATLIGGTTFTATWGAVSGATNYYLDVSTVATFTTFVSGYNNLLIGNVTSYTVFGLTQGTPYYYRVRAVNSCITSANSNTITVNTLTLTYCFPTYYSGTGSGDSITRVVLGTLNNVSGGAASPYYTFYNAVTIPNIYRNANSSISVSFGSDSRQYLGVWIDFNQNGTFEASEGVVTTNNAGGGGTSVVTITVPAGALLGNTRMRVRGGDDYAMTTAMACGATNSTWGETEDYIVNIIPIPACTVSLPTGLTSSFITGTTATISWSDASFSPSSVYEYAWSTSSTTPTSGTLLTGATSVNLSGLTPYTTYYFWVRTNCGGSNQSAWAGYSSFYTDPLDVVLLNSTTTGGSTTTCNARFYDSGGATGTYSSSESYTYTFVPNTTGSKLKVVFNSFVLENGYEFLSVYNGTSATPANLIGTYTGTQIAAGQTFYSTALGGELTFKFTSDGIINYAGWDASITCVIVPSITSFSPTSACSGATPVVTITGANFTGATSVSFNGVSVVPTTVTAATITVSLPATATTGLITVSTPTATGTSSSSFVIKPLPSTPNAGTDVAICIGDSVTLNAVGSIGNQTIVKNDCSSLAGWINNDTNRWSSTTTNNSGGAASGELKFSWFASGTTDSYIYLNQLINTTGYTSLNLSFRSMVDWFSNSFNLYVETSSDAATWTTRWNITPTADVAAGTVNVNLAALNGTSFYIRFRFNGDAYYINNWYIDDVTLSGVPTLTYTWATNSTLSSTSIYNPVATPTTTQTYTVSTSLNGCSSALSDSVDVVVNQRPTSVLSGTQAVCNGNTATLSVALTGTAPWTITYTNGVTPVTVSNILTSPYTITTTPITTAVTYTVTSVSDSKCSAISSGMTGSANVTIITPPTITVAASGVGVCYSNNSQTTTLNYTATTGTIATYSIYWNSTPYSNYATVTDAPFTGTPLTITVPGLLNNGTNNAYIIVKNSSGCVSASYSFTVDILPSPAVTINTSSRTVCYSTSSQIVSFPYSGANVLNSYDVTWNSSPANSFTPVSNVSFPGSSGNINVTVPAGTPAGTYIGTVTPRNSGCGAGAAPRTITVIVSQPAITPALSATPVCIDANAQTASLTFSSPVSNPTSYSIVWNTIPSNSFTSVTDAVLTTSPITPITISIPAGTSANTYMGTITVKNALTCVSTGVNFNVVVNPKPSMVSSFATATACPSSSAQAATLSYSAVANAVSYSVDWDSVANTAGLLDQGTTSDTFASGSLTSIIVSANLPVNQYGGIMTLLSSGGCTTTYALTMDVGKKWNGMVSSDWSTASNWTPSGEPSLSDCVFVSSGTPFAPTIASNALSGSLTINSGASLTVNSGYTLTVQDVVKTDGTLTVSDDASLVQISDVSNTGSGSMIYNREVTGLHGYDYIYWSSPVVSQSLSNLYTSPSSGPKYYWDTLMNNGNGASGNIGQGSWVAASGNLPVGKGVIIRASSGYGWSGSLTASFTGIPNNGTLTIPLHRGSYQGTVPYVGLNGMTISNFDDNYNLVGNPYPSAIDANAFLISPLNSPNIEGVVYLWTHGSVPNSSTNPFYGSYATNYSLSDYLWYNSLGASSGPGFNGKIASGQGFFVIMNDTDGPTVTDSSRLLTFNNTMRSATFGNSQFYKSSQTAASATTFERHRIWLDLVDATNSSTRTLVGYVDGATNGKDKMFDAVTKVGDSNSIYTISENENFVIQGRVLPFDENDQVQLGYNASVAGNFTIAIGAVDGLFEQGQSIYLEDKLLNVIYDLRQAPYNFTTVAGTFNNRFVIRYTNSALAINQYYVSNVAATIINGQLQIKANATIDTVQVYDLTGKLVKVYESAQKTTNLSEDFSFEKGVYFAKIKLIGGDLVTQKIMN